MRIITGWICRVEKVVKQLIISITLHNDQTLYTRQVSTCPVHSVRSLYSRASKRASNK